MKNSTASETAAATAKFIQAVRSIADMAAPVGCAYIAEVNDAELLDMMRLAAEMTSGRALAVPLFPPRRRRRYLP